MRVIAEPLAGKGFAPFGEERTIPASGRTFFDGALGNLRRSPPRPVACAQGGILAAADTMAHGDRSAAFAIFMGAAAKGARSL